VLGGPELSGSLLSLRSFVKNARRSVVSLWLAATATLLLAATVAPRPVNAAIDPNATSSTPAATIAPEPPAPTTPAPTTPVVPVATQPLATQPLPTAPVATQPVATVPTATEPPTIPATLDPSLITPTLPVQTIPDPNATTTIDPNATTTIDPNATTSTISLEPTSTLSPYEVFDEYLIPEVPEGVDLSQFSEFDDGSSSQDLESQIGNVGVSVYGSPALPTSFQAELNKLTAAQRQQVTEAQAKLAAISDRVSAAKEALDELTNSGRGSQDEIDRLNQQREQIAVNMKNRALRQYTGESARYLRLILESKDINTYRRRADLISQAQRRDTAVVEEYRLAANRIKKERARFDAILQARQFEVDQLEKEQKTLDDEFKRLQGILGALEAPVAFEGFVFPVQPPYAYSDTYGADRMNGTTFQHQHQGVDIFAREGTPVIATKRGVVYSIGVARLGGNRVWLKDVDGNCYYYAHLKEFASTIYDRKVVEAGEFLGTVGTTGNARGTPPHLHYEIHPNCAGPTNPNPILRAVEKADLEEWVRQTRPVFGVTSSQQVSTTVPPAGAVPRTGSSVPATTGRPLVGNAPGGSTAVLPTIATPRSAGSTRPAPKGANPTIPKPVFTPAPGTNAAATSAPPAAPATTQAG
jgi:murein DD-endopeptidase MepM/ murein hydrolase activator NlpD